MTLSEAIHHATELHRQGKLDQAEIIYAAILAQVPGHFDTLHQFGMLRCQQGRNAEALPYMYAAANVNPDAVAVLTNIGVVHASLNQPEEALASCDKALALKPDGPEALYIRGNALMTLRRPEEALASFDRSLALRGDNVDALCNQGGALCELRRFAEAVTSYDRALVLRPSYAEAHFNRGNALAALGSPADALASYDRALALKPDFADALNNRGLALAALDRAADALASYDRALALRPGYAEAFCNRGVALTGLKRYDEALASYDRAIALRPAYAKAFNNRGSALMELGRPDEALASCDQAVAFGPGNAEVLCNRGTTLMDLKRPAEALASFDSALALNPDHPDAGLARSLCLLLQGEYDRGWRDYEYRWAPAHLRHTRRDFAQPLWLGDQDIGGKTILLHAEQGLGDAIQFSRFAKLVGRQGARVLLEVQPALRSLMTSLDRSIRVIARDDSSGDAALSFDYHCPLMSLPLAFKLTLGTIPADIPYLFAPPEKTRLWHARLGAGTRPRVGLAWAGNPKLGMPRTSVLDSQRSIAFDRLAPLFGQTACEFYSLQKGDDAVAQLRSSVYRTHVVDWTDDFSDFEDTAALMANLDLVIAVDTAVAHLAGALGKPFWLLNRHNTCWRWLLDRNDSPWYPTARIFRQPAYGDWTSVIANVAAELRQWSEARPADRHIAQHRALAV